MRNLPVHWYEGMFLRPQHFQAADRFWHEYLASSQNCDVHYNYGIREIEINQAAIEHQKFEVNQIRARMPDGTLVSLGEGAQAIRVDLEQPFQDHAELTVFLAVPQLAMGRTNVSRDLALRPRYVELDQSQQDESAGGNDQSLQFLNLNAQLRLSSEDLAGFEVLPIARLKRAGEGSPTPSVDLAYVPPCLAIDGWQPLGIGFVRNIYDMIGARMDVLAQRTKSRGTNLTSQEPGDLDDLFMLSSLNACYGTLAVMAFASGIHPLTAYTELCRILGQLSIFSESKKAPEIPPYDHDDLARIFRWVMDQITELLGGGPKEQDYEQRFFVGTDLGMQVSIKPEWLHEGWQWFVGVVGENIPERESRELLMPGKLNWKMGSSQQVGTIFQFGMPGVELAELMQAPRMLPSKRGWLYYEVKKQGGAWADVLATQSLEIRFADKMIGNLDKLLGQQTLEVISDNKRSLLQFALFAVPPVKSS